MTCCCIILLFIFTDVISVIVFELAIPADDQDCFSRDSIPSVAITCAVLLVFTVELLAQLAAHGKRYFIPFRASNYMDVTLIVLSVAVEIFQALVEFSLPVTDDSGNYLPPVVTKSEYPALCANATSSSDSAKTTQRTFTAVRALRLVARVGIAFRVLRALVKIAKLAQLLGGSRGKRFDGHDAMVTSVVFAPPAADPAHAKGKRPLVPSLCRGKRAAAEGQARAVPIWGKWRLLTASADSTVHMYDILSTDMGSRRGEPADGHGPGAGTSDLVHSRSPV